jgi:hypothetical protein
MTPQMPFSLHEKPDTHHKALRVNLDRRRYGTFAEIGAGQEVVRWFFRVGGASGTIAKSISAYDMAVSDAIYGECDRYVSRSRLESMLNHEYQLNLDRLTESRGDSTAFFAFADTVSARNFSGTNDCHGWIGVRFQVYPRDEASQIILHVRMLDKDVVQQQEALGIVGVNLVYGAFFLHHEPDELLESLQDDLVPGRIEIDMIEFSGIGFRQIYNRLASLKLVQLGLSDAAMFDAATGKVLQPSEVFRKKSVLVERGSFRPVTHVNLDILRAAKEKFSASLPEEERDSIVQVAEITMKNLLANEKVDHKDFLSRADMLAACGMTVLISDYFEYYRLAAFLNQHTKKRIAITLGAVSLKDLFDPKYYTHLDGGILESFGRLFKNDLKIYVYPYLNPQTQRIETVENVVIQAEQYNLFTYLLEHDHLVHLDNYTPEYLGIFSRSVLKAIESGDASWEKAVPTQVAQIIKQRQLFGYHRS